MSSCRECGGELVAMCEDVESTTVGYAQGSCGRDHDDNCVMRIAWCADGHATTLDLRRRCNDQEPQRSWGEDVEDVKPACDWRGKEQCGVCGNRVKIDVWPDLPIRPRFDS